MGLDDGCCALGWAWWVTIPTWCELDRDGEAWRYECTTRVADTDRGGTGRWIKRVVAISDVQMARVIHVVCCPFLTNAEHVS